MKLAKLTPQLSSAQHSAAWLIRIRWAALLGQFLVFLGAKYILGIQLSAAAFTLISATLILSNLLLLTRIGQIWLAQRAAQGFVLIFDVALLTALLYAYGGHTNPFSIFYLIHVVLAAMLLSAFWTWGISILCSLCYAALFRWYIPIAELSMGHGHGQRHGGGDEFSLHLEGMLVGFVLISLLISAFVQRMRAEIDRREQELVRRRSNEERLAAVTTISASIAHELGSPLGAMMLIADDLQGDLLASRSIEAITGDVELLRSQLQRCSAALGRLRQGSGELFGEVPQQFSLADLVASLNDRLAKQELSRVQIDAQADASIIKLPKEGLSHILHALVKNGLEACADGASVQAPVLVTLRVDSTKLYLQVVDSGKGMTQEELSQVGEPFFTTKDSQRGMGLGLFIAKLFTERFGGALRVESTLDAGTRVEIELPRKLEEEPD